MARRGGGRLIEGRLSFEKIRYVVKARKAHGLLLSSFILHSVILKKLNYPFVQ